jgi:hypothetical protein
MKRQIQARRKRGTLAEFAPALYVLLIVIFFPMLDIVGILLSYADCQYLNFILTRQAGLENILSLNNATPPALQVSYAFVTDPNGVFRTLINNWYNGIGHYTTRSLGDINVSANVDLTQGTAKLKYVTVVTTIVCNPLLPIPFPYAIPGFNAPETFTISGTSVIEYVPNVFTN